MKIIPKRDPAGKTVPLSLFRRVLVVAIIFGVQPLAAAPGDLVKIEKLGSLSKVDIEKVQSQLGQTQQLPSPLNGIVFYKMTYETLSIHNTPTAVTGLVIVPDQAQGQYPLLSFQHGTTFQKSDVPSSLNAEGQTAAVLFGAQGYVVSAPDYLGLGDSAEIHPYDHVDSEAWVNAHMLQATRGAVEQLGIRLNSELFLAGYSQGGHATMALHRYLEMMNLKGLEVTASAPMAGAYDLSQTSLQLAFKNPARSGPAFMAYIIASMNAVYGIHGDLGSVYLPAALPLVTKDLDGTYGIKEVMNGLPKTFQDFLQPDFIDGILKNPNHSFVKNLRKNDVYAWKSKAPVFLIYGGGDIDSPYQNSIVAYQEMKRRGGNVRVINVGDQFDHATAQLPAFMLCQQLFRGR
jgi:pimeloyl-ACP methyl ester carboxylesterase